MQSPVLNVSSGDGPKVATDKVDYAPGETVAIDGWGWTAGEVVRLQVIHVDAIGDNSTAEHQSWDVTADAEGNIASTWTVPADDGGAELKLSADGQLSGMHAELLLTDLIGSVALYADAGRTTSQNAYTWGATIYPRLTGATSNICYQIQWTNPSSVVQQTTTFGPGTGTLDPASFTLPATNASGTWSVVVSQNTSANCSGPFTSASNAILFDVARALVLGAGTTGDDALGAGGDQCLAQNTAPPGGCGAGSTSVWVRSQNGNNIRSVLKFDLTGVIPAGRIVTDAKVRLTIIGTTSSKTYNMQRASAAWDEGTATFAGVGVTGSIYSATIPGTLTPGAGGGDPQTWAKWTVTADVQGFHDGSFTNDGWRINDASENASSPVDTRFTSTENVCTPGTTCNRVKPVLLIDYVEPPKLAFITGPFTGIVGQCLGPMRVQSQTFAGSALAVGSNLTVDMSTASLGAGAGGVPGAGSFFSNSTCTTGTTTTTITTGNTNSSDFYYRATHRGDGSHDLVAHATGYTPDAVQTQTINKAPTTTTYTGDLVILVGNTFNLSAVITSPYAGCVADRRVLFRLEPNPATGTGFIDFGGFATTSSSGVATRSSATTNWQEGVYDLTVNAIDNDDCLAQKAVPNPVITVIAPGAAATGGGFLAGGKVGGGRVNFGFTVRAVEGTSDPIQYKGQFLLMKQDGGVPSFRCKGTLDTYGSVPNTDPTKYAASGKCDFQQWDPALNGGLGDWFVPAGAGYLGQEFTIYFIDNGQGKGKDAPPPDQFGFTVGFVGPAIANPTFPLADINGGNIDAKGTSTTTSGTKGGKKG